MPQLTGIKDMTHSAPMAERWRRGGAGRLGLCRRGRVMPHLVLRGNRMAEPTYQPSAAQRPENVADPIDDAAALERALEIVPRGRRPRRHGARPRDARLALRLLRRVPAARRGRLGARRRDRAGHPPHRAALGAVDAGVVGLILVVVVASSLALALNPPSHVEPLDPQTLG